MHSQLAQRLRRNSLTSLPPPQSSPEYSQTLAGLSAHILYRNPLPSQSGLPIFILNAAAFPDAKEVDYDVLLPYVLSRLPGEEELIGGKGYEVIFLAGGGDEDSTSTRKGRPGWGWFVQAYHVLTRAMRKRLQKLHIVHERAWVRILVEMFSTIVSPKFRKKIVHVSTLTALALHISLEDLLIPPSAYLHDRRLSPDIYAPYVTGRRAFGVRQPFPISVDGEQRLPRVLRETTSFVLLEENIQTEGIFRIPPHNRLLDVLREAYDRGQKFILWKEGNVVLPLPKTGDLDCYGVVEEVDQKKGYGIALATGLIKLWYRELRDPIFTQSTYKELERLFGNEDASMSIEQLAEFIAFDSEWSPVSQYSRMILASHLFPMLSEVSAYQQSNKMTAFNLAVCFAPALLCGPDPMEDIRIGAIVRKLIEASITQWNLGLRDACGIGEAQFRTSLQPPRRAEDYEDPLEEKPKLPPRIAPAEVDTSGQSQGIVLEDREIPLPVGIVPPPLPPRRPQLPETDGPPRAVKRKPAPAVVFPPRYSVIMAGESAALNSSPVSYANVADGFGNADRYVTENHVGVEGKGVRSNSKGSQEIFNSPQGSFEKQADVTDGFGAAIRYENERNVETDEKGNQRNGEVLEGDSKGAQGSNDLIDLYENPLTVRQIDNNTFPHATQAVRDSRSCTLQTGARTPSSGSRVVLAEIKRKPLPPPQSSQSLPFGSAASGLSINFAGRSSSANQTNDMEPLPRHSENTAMLPPNQRRHLEKQQTEPSFTKPTRSFSSQYSPNPMTSSLKTPTILNLAKPIQLAPPSLSHRTSLTHLPTANNHVSFASTPTLLRKRPSTGLLSERLDAFKQQEQGQQQPQRAKSDVGPQRRKLIVGEGTVGDLRRLYEERAGAARSLVEAGR